MTFREKLIELNACESSSIWLKNKDAREAWWALRKTNNATKEQSIAFANFCSKNARKLAERDERAEWAAERAESAERAAEWAKWAVAERKAQADFLRQLIKFEDIKL